MAIENNKHMGITLEECCRKHSGLVYKIAKRYEDSAVYLGIDFDDIFQIGMMGLMLSYSRFDPEKVRAGNKTGFANYAGVMIKGEIMTHFRDRGLAVRYPPSYRRAWQRMGKVRTFVDVYTPESLSEETGISVTDADAAMKLYDSRVVVSAFSKIEDSGYTAYEKHGKECDFSRIIVDDIISKLNEREQIIVNMLLDDKTQLDVSKFIGLSHQRVNTIVALIRKKVAAYYKEEKVV